MPTAPAVDPQLIAKTHAAIFDMWFPLDELPMPPPVKPEIAAIAAEVSAGMLRAFSGSALMEILTGMTYPASLPFYACLAQSRNPAVLAFLTASGGFGGLAIEHRQPLFSFFFDGPCVDGPCVDRRCLPGSAMFAMILREAYLSGIWDLPLAVPLTEIQAPAVFMQNPDIYSKIHAPALPPSRLTTTSSQTASSIRTARLIASWLAAAPEEQPSPTNCTRPGSAWS
jgi:hypothetical protein